MSKKMVNLIVILSVVTGILIAAVSFYKAYALMTVRRLSASEIYAGIQSGKYSGYGDARIPGNSVGWGVDGALGAYNYLVIAIIGIVIAVAVPLIVKVVLPRIRQGK
jgi:putative effector of murein hydrolase